MPMLKLLDQTRRHANILPTVACNFPTRVPEANINIHKRINIRNNIGKRNTGRCI